MGLFNNIPDNYLSITAARSCNFAMEDHIIYPNFVEQVEEKYEYDLVGNLTKLTDANNNSTLYSYDNLNQLTKVTNPLGEVTDYAYDRLGDLTQIQCKCQALFSLVR